MENATETRIDWKIVALDLGSAIRKEFKSEGLEVAQTFIEQESGQMTPLFKVFDLSDRRQVPDAAIQIFAREKMSALYPHSTLTVTCVAAVNLH